MKIAHQLFDEATDMMIDGRLPQAVLKNLEEGSRARRRRPAPRASGRQPCACQILSRGDPPLVGSGKGLVATEQAGSPHAPGQKTLDNQKSSTELRVVDPRDEATRIAFAANDMQRDLTFPR
jgi:hypothetical protein